MSSYHMGKRTPSVFAALEETITNARRFCARQVIEGRMNREDLRPILLALGLDETAQFSENVRTAGIDYPLMQWN